MYVVVGFFLWFVFIAVLVKYSPHYALNSCSFIRVNDQLFIRMFQCECRRVVEENNYGEHIEFCVIFFGWSKLKNVVAMCVSLSKYCPPSPPKNQHLRLFVFVSIVLQLLSVLMYQYWFNISFLIMTLSFSFSFLVFCLEILMCVYVSTTQIVGVCCLLAPLIWCVCVFKQLLPTPTTPL